MSYQVPDTISEFRFSQIGSGVDGVVRVVRQGNYNIQDTNISECDSEDIGKDISDYYEDGYEETIKKNELSTTPDETRYFKCSSHCGKR